MFFFSGLISLSQHAKRIEGIRERADVAGSLCVFLRCVLLLQTETFSCVRLWSFAV